MWGGECKHKERVKGVFYVVGRVASPMKDDPIIIACECNATVIEL